jgi:hypothetical protein
LSYVAIIDLNDWNDWNALNDWNKSPKNRLLMGHCGFHFFPKRAPDLQ